MKTSRRTAALMAALLMAATIVAEPASGLPSGGRLTETDPGGSVALGDPDGPSPSHVQKVDFIDGLVFLMRFTPVVLNWNGIALRLEAPTDEVGARGSLARTRAND